MHIFALPLSVGLLLVADSAYSVVLHATRQPSSSRPRKGATFVSGNGAGSNAAPTLENIQSQRYVSNITLNGQNFRVAIDTGSSDLWVVLPSTVEFSNTGIQGSIAYSSNTVVTGPIGFASVELGGYTFAKQAFVSATQVGLGGIVNFGLDGLIGFAFDGTSPSPITAALVAQGSPPTAGQPFLFNIFDQTPDMDNFIGISLSRTGDLEGSADASFTVNEIDETYAAVFNSTAIPIFPPDKPRWNLLLDAVTVDGNAMPIPASVVTSTAAATPAGKIVVLMDTGTPTAQMPADLVNAIYSSIPGALFSSSQQNWIIPCNTTSIVTVVIGGQSFPIHPLDLTTVMVTEGVTVCVAAFAAGPGNADFDALFGDSIMRNIYSVYANLPSPSFRRLHMSHILVSSDSRFNFGSAIAKSPDGGSSMQLLSQTDPNTAKADVINVRMAALAAGPPEGVPPSFAPVTTVDPPPVVAAAALGSSDVDSDSDGAQIRKYAPIVIGLLSANLLVVLVLAVIGVALCVKRGGKSSSGVGGPKYVPVLERQHIAGRTSESYEEDKRYSD
ncbi:aspartic peptidase domain-containing protein [Mycena epipterygia]|nr:aspartic peptidase domain-containing protein [Mycena epipterygia]